MTRVARALGLFSQNLHNGVCYAFNVNDAGASYCPSGTSQCTPCSGCWGESSGFCQDAANSVCFGYYPDAPGVCPAGTTACSPVATPALASDSSAAAVFVVSMTGITAADFSGPVRNAFVASVAAAAGVDASAVALVAVYDQSVGGGQRARALTGAPMTVLNVQFTIASSDPTAAAAAVGAAVRGGAIGAAVSASSGASVAVFAQSLDQAAQLPSAPAPAVPAYSAAPMSIALVAGVAVAAAAALGAVGVAVACITRRRAAAGSTRRLVVSPKKVIPASYSMDEPSRMVSVMP
jgi:hypothetical protein